MDEKLQRRKKLKKNKRKRLLKYVTLLVVAVSILFVFIFVMASAISAGVFNIKHIEVIGNEVVDSETIVETSGINEGESIFWVDLNKAHYNIEELINVEKLEITKVMPDKIVIKVKEAPAICAVNYDGKINYINREGLLVERSEYLRKTDIPIVTGFTDITIDKIGHPVTFNPDWKFDTVMEILKTFQNDGNLAKISEVGITENNTYRIITKNNVVMTVSDLDNFKGSYDYINTVFTENKSNLDINLTTGGNKPILKPR